MMISGSVTRLHWNYFLALERDLEKVARFIEFSEKNFSVYSIELAHLLFAAASEVDVVAKRLCEHFDSKAPRKNILDYHKTLKKHLPNIATTQVFVPRFGLEFSPWHKWNEDSTPDSTPDWWKSYNNVKHERHRCFAEATLENVLNALGALLVLTFNYYTYALSSEKQPLDPMETMSKLEPQSSILRLSDDHYYGQVVFGKIEW
jgi:hypothetical protein